MVEELNEEEFQKLSKPSYDLEGEKEKQKEELLGIYRTIIDVLKYYCDIEEKYYSLIALWILGTYFHEDFPTYPYLFFNAMKGSGKSRTLRLITILSKNGLFSNSLTEAVLFRTKGTLGIDEFEKINDKGQANLLELLNSAYKKGAVVVRMNKMKTLSGEEQVPVIYSVFRPVVMANIRGMEEVLSDRCLTIILDKSTNPKIIKKMEIYENDTRIQKIKEFPFEACRLCRSVSIFQTYKGWNDYCDTINDTYNTTTLTTQTTQTTQEKDYSFYKKIDDSGIQGRNLELTLPLLILAYILEEETFEDLLKTIKEIVEEKKKDDSNESIDISLIDFVSQETSEGKWIFIKELVRNFKIFLNSEEDWINEKWFGKALKRLNLIKDKKRVHNGRLIILNIEKAQEKIKAFK